jgi:hypothetical protein
MRFKAKLFNRDNIGNLLDVFLSNSPKLVVRFVLNLLITLASRLDVVI